MKIKALNLTSNAISGALSYRADQGWDITMTNGGFTVVKGDLGFFFSGSKCDAVLDVSHADYPEPTEERMSNLPANKGRRRGPRGPKKQQGNG